MTEEQPGQSHTLEETTAGDTPELSQPSDPAADTATAPAPSSAQDTDMPPPPPRTAPEVSDGLVLMTAGSNGA